MGHSLQSVSELLSSSVAYFLGIASSNGGTLQSNTEPSILAILKVPLKKKEDNFIQLGINEEQNIAGYSIDGAMGSSGGGRVRKLSLVCLHNNAIVARGILVTILHCGTPEPHLSAIYIVSSVGTSLCCFKIYFFQYYTWLKLQFNLFQFLSLKNSKCSFLKSRYASCKSLG